MKNNVIPRPQVQDASLSLAELSALELTMFMAIPNEPGLLMTLSKKRWVELFD